MFAAVQLATVALAPGCKHQTYRVARADWHQAVEQHETDPDLPVLAVHNGSVMRLRGADIAEGRVRKGDQSDPVWLDYTDARTAVAITGYVAGAITLMAAGVIFPIGYGLAGDDKDALTATTVVATTIVAMSLGLVIYGAVAPSPFPRAAKERVEPPSQ